MLICIIIVVVENDNSCVKSMTVGDYGANSLYYIPVDWGERGQSDRIASDCGK